MQKTKIIINAIVPKPINFDGKTGSVVRLEKILKELIFLNKDLQITINTTPWMAEYFKKNGVETDYQILKSNLKFKSYFGLCLKSLFLSIKSLLVFGIPNEKTEKNVIVYSSSDLFWEVIPAFFYKLINKKICWIQVIHHIYPNWKKRPGNKIINLFGFFLQKFSLFFIKIKVDKIIVVNEIVKKQLQKIGFQEHKIFINSNGIDFEYFKTIHGNSICYDGIFLGRLSHSKGIFDLIDIWKKVCQNIPEAKLVLIGGGEEKTKKILLEKIAYLGLKDNIDILGFLNDKQAHKILNSSKIFLFPSHEEGWGIVIAEAMACGLPVISWDLPVYKLVFENYTIQIKENATDEFAKKIIKFLKNDSSRNDFAQKGNDFIKKYSWKNVAQKEYEILKNNNNYGKI